MHATEHLRDLNLYVPKLLMENSSLTILIISHLIYMGVG